MAKGLLLICCIQVIALIVISQVAEVSSKGTLTIAFIQYLNVKGKGANGHCCDGRWGMCTSECDHMFTLCLDSIKSPNETHPCEVNKTETAAYKNQNNIMFGDDIGGLDNPMVWHMEPLMTAVSLKVAVWDKDKTGSNDYVDFLRLDLGKRPYDLDIGRWYTINMTHRTTLEVQVRFDCDKNWYGDRCSVQCKPPRSKDEHFLCDKRTGQKRCDLGWEGPTCATRSNMCTPRSCKNGGTCSWQNNQEYCDCSSEFSGPRCEEDKCNDWCNPGKCGRWKTGATGYTCICPSGYESVQPPGAGAQCRWKDPNSGTGGGGGGGSNGGGGSSNGGGGGNSNGGGGGGSSNGGGGGGGHGGGGSNGGGVERNQDCKELSDNGYRYRDGMYELRPGAGRPFLAYCDMTDGKGWTIIMHRSNGETNFYRGWKDYKEGFGQPGEDSDHWIGLEPLHEMTTNKRYKLYIMMQTADYREYYAEYDNFEVGDEISSYKLTIGRYRGNAGDAFGLSEAGDDPSMGHNGMRFSTYDKDNDKWYYGNCARDFKSGWWFNSCFSSNLNGVFTDSFSRPCEDAMCIQWRTVPEKEDYSLRAVTMKIIPA